MPEGRLRPILAAVSCWWRPLTGWACALGIAVQYVVRPIAELCFHLAGHPVTLPSLDTGGLASLVTATLGMAGVRTAEKLKDVNS